MYIWIVKRPNILAYLENVSVALCVEKISVELSVKEISVSPRVANFQGYMNSHLVRCYNSACKIIIVRHKIKENTNKKQKMKCFVYEMF